MVHPEFVIDLPGLFPIEIVQPNPHGLIGKNELLAVGRPVRITLSDTAAAGEIAGDAMLGGNRKDVASCLKDCALAGGGDVWITRKTAYFLGQWLERGPIRPDFDIDLTIFL